MLAFNDREARIAGVVVTKEERSQTRAELRPYLRQCRHVIGAIEMAGPLDLFTPAAMRKYEREIKKTPAAVSRDPGDRES